MTVTTIVNELPDCILLRIFKHCQSKVDLWKARSVCKRWYVLLADSELWRVCNLSEFELDDEDSFTNAVNYMPLASLKHLEIANKTITTLTMQTLLEAANQLHGLRLNQCTIRNTVSNSDQNNNNNNNNNNNTTHADQNNNNNNINNNTTHADQNNNNNDVVTTTDVTSSSSRDLVYLDMRRTNGDLRVFGEVLMENGPSLKVLGISNSFSALLSLKTRSFIHYVPNLTVLEFSDCTWVNDHTVRDIANTCFSLESLNLTKCLNVRGTSMESLIRKCKQLKTLVLHRTSVRNQDMSRAKWISSSITELDISSCYHLDEVLHQIVLALAPQLRYLRCAFTDELAEDLSKLDALPIRTLELRRRYPLDMSIIGEFLTRCVKLEALDFSLIPVEYDTFKRVLPHLPHLSWLSFTGNEDLRTIDTLKLITKYCKCIENVGINYYHSICEAELTLALHGFIQNNETLKVFNIEGVNVGDVHEQLQNIQAWKECNQVGSPPQRRDIEITKIGSFELPSPELGVDRFIDTAILSN